MGIGLIETVIILIGGLFLLLLFVAAPIAIVMALFSAKRRSGAAPTDHKRAPCPHCKNLVLLTDATCPHCGKMVA